MYIISVFLICTYLRIFNTHLHIFKIHVYIFLIHVYVFLIHVYVFLIHIYVFFKIHVYIFLIHVDIFLIHVYIFLIHINIFQLNKYAAAARQENYNVRPVTSTNFPSARWQIQVGAVLSRPKSQLRHYLNPTWVGFSKVPTKTQLRHNSPPKHCLSCTLSIT